MRMSTYGEGEQQSYANRVYKMVAGLGRRVWPAVGIQRVQTLRIRLLAWLMVPISRSQATMHSGQTWKVKQPRPLANSTGQSLVEYALIMVLVAIVAIGAIVFLGADIASAFQAISNAL